ncbi:MAG TPA: peptidoglycan editing factor PgeF [Armatimonadota bacterium]|jgi:hypothetical protein
MALEVSFGCDLTERAGITLLQWAAWLREGVPHGISSRHGGVSRPPYASLNLSDSVGDGPGAVVANRARLGAALGDMRRPRIFAKQVHEASVHAVRELPPGSQPPPEADALITNRTDVYLALTFADCVPVLFYDQQRRAVGVAHGGWRGLEAGILQATVRAMQAEYGTEPPRLQAAIGPHIGVCCYEVGEDVAARFAGIPRAVHRDDDGRITLNLARVARAKLAAAGLTVENVAISAACTSCFHDAYFSHRADGPTGRFAAAIGLEPLDAR